MPQAVSDVSRLQQSRVYVNAAAVEKPRGVQSSLVYIDLLHTTGARDYVSGQ